MPTILTKDVGKSVHGLAKFMASNTQHLLPQVALCLIEIAHDAGKRELGRAVFVPGGAGEQFHAARPGL